VAGLRIRFREDNIGRQFDVSMKKHGRRIGGALLQTARDARDEILDRGRRDISGAGNFGTRWTQGLKGVLRRLGGDQTQIFFTHAISYFTVFTKRTVIRGKPLLWIPLSFAADAQGVMARNFPGGLFRVDRKGGGAPLLLSVRTGEPKYFGKRSVTIPKKFAFFDIVRSVAANLRNIYKQNIAARKG
jgi:hypothetical protein